MSMKTNMQATDYHAKYYAALLQERYAADDVRRLLPALTGADIVYNPHQLQAALFALRSPWSKGAVLADEQGLGKMVEAALMLATYYAEGKDALILCAPQRRMQCWKDHLTGQLGIPVIKQSEFPEKKGVILLTVGQAIRSANWLTKIKWDACVIDEAHRVATADAFATGRGTGHVLMSLFQNCKTILITSEPIQSGLMDLYYLLQMVDGHAFGGGVDVFKDKYVEQKNRQGELRWRVQRLYHRTLARHVPSVIQKRSMQKQAERSGVASDDWDRLRKQAIADSFSAFDSQTVATYKEYTRIIKRELPHMQNMLYQLTKYTLLPYATFHDASSSFVIHGNVDTWGLQKNQIYRMHNAKDEEEAYSMLHPLSQKIISESIKKDIGGGQLTLHHGNGMPAGTSGVMGLWRVSAFIGYNKFASKLLLMGRTANGKVLNHRQCEQLLRLSVHNCQYGAVVQEGDTGRSMRTQTVSGQDKVALASPRKKMIQSIKATMQKQMQRLYAEELQKHKYYVEDRLYASQMHTRVQRKASTNRFGEVDTHNEQIFKVEQSVQRSRKQASRRAEEQRIKKDAADEKHALQELSDLRFKQDELFMVRFNLI